MKKVLLNRNSHDVDLNIIRQADGWPLMDIIPFLCNIGELVSIISFRVCQSIKKEYLLSGCTCPPQNCHIVSSNQFPCTLLYFMGPTYLKPNCLLSRFSLHSAYIHKIKDESKKVNKYQKEREKEKKMSTKKKRAIYDLCLLGVAWCTIMYHPVSLVDHHVA